MDLESNIADKSSVELMLVREQALGVYGTADQRDISPGGFPLVTTYATAGLEPEARPYACTIQTPHTVTKAPETDIYPNQCICGIWSDTISG